MIAALSDIHSNFLALERVLSGVRNCRLILNAGDTVGYNARPNECIELVKKRGVVSVIGNHDYACITGRYGDMNIIAVDAVKWTRKNLDRENLAYLKKIPEIRRITHERREIVVLHGSPRDKLHGYVFPWTTDELLEDFLSVTRADILVLGHTHVPFVKKISGRLVVNPGSVGQPRDHNRRSSYALIDARNMKARIVRVEYDIPKACNELVKAGMHYFLAERLFFGL